jgi:MFS family permease
MANRTLLTVSIIATLLQFITFSTAFSFTTAYASSVLGSSPVQNGWLIVVPSFLSALGALLLAKKWAKKFPAYWLVMVGMVIIGVSAMVTPLITRFDVLVITQAAAGVGRGISFTLLMGLAIKNIPPQNRGLAMGFFQSVYALGMFMGPFVTGVISDTLSLGLGFVLVGGICTVAAFVSFYALKNMV